MVLLRWALLAYILASSPAVALKCNKATSVSLDVSWPSVAGTDLVSALSIPSTARCALLDNYLTAVLCGSCHEREFTGHHAADDHNPANHA